MWDTKTRTTNDNSNWRKMYREMIAMQVEEFKLKCSFVTQE